MAYPNLDAELSRYGINREEVANLIHKSVPTISLRINGNRSDFTISECQTIRDAFFPDMSLDYLFSKEPRPGQKEAMR